MGRILITIEYKEQLPLPQMTAEIAQMASPHVLLWYIGIYGLKKEGVRFYRDSIIDPIAKRQNNAHFWLVDLTAWGALRNPKITINTASSLVDKIEGFGIQNVKCIKSSETFEKMQEIKDLVVVDHFQKALQRGFVHKASQEFPESQIQIKDLLECPIVSPCREVDASKCYSALQYLEGCLLIDRVVQECLKEEKIEIVFALPNDELKYYRDETHAFQKDVEFFLNHKYGSKLRDVKVTFYSFDYGDDVSHRPYNAPGKVFHKNELSCDDILKKPLRNLGERHDGPTKG
jgi:hypothetical protein